MGFEIEIYFNPHYYTCTHLICRMYVSDKHSVMYLVKVIVALYKLQLLMHMLHIFLQKYFNIKIVYCKI